MGTHWCIVTSERKVIFPLGIRDSKSCKTLETVKASSSPSVAQGPSQGLCEVRAFFTVKLRCYLTFFFSVFLQVEVEFSSGYMACDIATN